MVPQIILLTLHVFALEVNAANHGQEKKNKKYDFWVQLIAVILVNVFLWWGGFYDPLLP